MYSAIMTLSNISDKYYLSSSLLCVWRIQDKVETKEGNIEVQEMLKNK